MMDGARCLQCGKFLKDARAWANGDGIQRVEGVCVTHGEVAAMPGFAWMWDAWDFPDELGTGVDAGTNTAEAG